MNRVYQTNLGLSLILCATRRPDQPNQAGARSVVKKSLARSLVAHFDGKKPRTTISFGTDQNVENGTFPQTLIVQAVAPFGVFFVRR